MCLKPRCTTRSEGLIPTVGLTINKSGFQWSVLEAKPINQFKPGVNTCSWCDARDSEFERVAIGFALASVWMKKWREFF